MSDIVAAEVSGMWRVLRRRDFRLLWSAHLTSNVGGWLLVVAVPVYVYQLTGSAVSTGLAFVAETLPGLIFGPVVGVFVDRWSRRTIMVVCDLLRAGTVLLLILVTDSDLLWLLYLLIFAENSLTQLFQPATRALLPTVVGTGSDLSAANALYSVSSGIVRLSGGPLGGALFALTGFRALVIIDAATYLVSAILLFALRVGHDRTVPAADPAGAESAPAGRVRRFGAELRAGIGHLRDRPVLRGLMVVSSWYFLVNGGASAILVPFIAQRLHGGSRDWGLLLSALGAGFLIGAPIAHRLAAPERLRVAVAGCLLGVGLSFAGLFSAPTVPVALVFAGLAGIPGGAVLVLFQTQLQREAPNQILGRVSALFSTAEMTATVAGAAAASLLTKAVAVTTVVDSAAALVILLAIVSPLLIPRPVRQPPDEGASVPDQADPHQLEDGPLPTPTQAPPEPAPTAPSPPAPR